MVVLPVQKKSLFLLERQLEIVPTEQPTDEDAGSGKVGLRDEDAGDRRAAYSSSEGDDNNQQKSQPKEQNNQPQLA